MKKYQQLKNIFKRVSQLQYAQRILMWDEAVMMPHGAQESRANTVATLNRTIQKMIMNKKVKALIQDARLEDGLSDWDQANLNLIEKKHIRATCLPLKLTEESTKASIRCEQAWRKLRPDNNWNDFLPYFEKSFRLVKEMAVRESQALGLDPYDAMLDTYSPGFNQKNIDNIFSLLKQTLPPLVQQIYSKLRTEQIQIQK
jgi:carboxypeptidase Taq